MGIIKNDSAQFMLLAGFIISIGLVLTTVMLNNIIFESNMAGEEGGGPLKYDVVNLMQISGDEMKSAYRNATNINIFSNQMNNFNANLSYIYARHGQGVNVSWDVSNWANIIPAHFSENGTANGETNWTVIENVRNSNITINFTTTGTLNISLVNSTTMIWINLTTNSSFENTSSTPYSIIFNNGANTAGTFRITGNTSNNRSFIRSRDYIMNATILFSTSQMRANITFPVSVPW